MHAAISDIGEFIQYKSCQRRFKLDYDGARAFKEVDFSTESFFDIDPVLQAAGAAREEQWESSLSRAGLRMLAEPMPGERHVEAFDLFQALEDAYEGEAGYAREVRVEGKVGAFTLRGRVDFVVLEWRDGTPCIRLVECKASRKDKTYHRVQAVLYRCIFRDMVRQFGPTIGGVPLEEADVEAVVVRIDESSGALQSIFGTPPIEMGDAIEADVRRVLSGDGVLARAIENDLEDVPYQLEAKCDACHFAAHCFTQAATHRRLELLGLTPSTVRSLKSAGIETLDDLADIDPQSDEADSVRRHPDFVGDLVTLQRRASARRATLDDESEDPPVQYLQKAGYGQLPDWHEYDQPFVRVFVSVTYDYTENRIAGLAAHVTASRNELDIYEGELGEMDPDGDAQELDAIDICRFKSAPWTGRYEVDSGAELEMLQSFFRSIVDAVRLQAGSDEAVLHFYVWSRYEMTQLLEACSRVGSGMLSSFRELLGCRDKLEQLIFSCVQQDVMTRYALGWTGAGLVVATSVPWSGSRYDWRRRVGSEVVDLAKVFHRDIFDFKQDIYGDGRDWEVRSCFADNLVAPYWYAYWGALDDLEPDRNARGIDDYLGAARPGVLEAYLRARTHATRWLEESIEYKNKTVEKTSIDLSSLPRFRLDTASAVSAAVDFLRFDQHVGFSDWIQAHLTPSYVRVSAGASMPVRDLETLDDRGLEVGGFVDPEAYHTTLDALRARCPLGEGGFVRLTEVQNPQWSPSFKSLSVFGRTCIIKKLDWRTGAIELKIILGSGDDAYTVPSWSFTDNFKPWKQATLDASISDFVSRRVERRLLKGPAKSLEPQGAHVNEWFDPHRASVKPAAEPDADALADARGALDTLGFFERRIDIVERGISSRIQLVQGPPGTGKTTLTSAAILARIMVQIQGGGIVLVGAGTHTAVDTLMDKIAETSPRFEAALDAEERAHFPKLNFFKIDAKQTVGEVESLKIRPPSIDSWRDRFNHLLQAREVAVVAGTTAGLLKFGDTIGNYLDTHRGTGLLAPLLVVDEASMMVFAHFLALASHVHPDGAIMLAGDHRQLSPIVSHDWANDDRPPAVRYQPHVSAFEGIRALEETIRDTVAADRKITLDGLEVTFRLPPQIRDLINPVYAKDGLQLQGPPDEEAPVVSSDEVRGLEAVWLKGASLVLVLHDESESRSYNKTEVELVRGVLDANAASLKQDSVAVITPHRAQRAMLGQRLEDYSDVVTMIDTVERMQGGECDTIIFSATESDPVAVAQNESFILDLNRSNVAFSRTKRRLVVICSRSLLDHIPDSVEGYEAAMLWKLLRATCDEVLDDFEFEGHRVRVSVPSPIGK